MTLAEKIAALRGEHKLSQGGLAEKLDVSRQSVSKWETGQAVPELDKIIKLADLFGVSVDELVRTGDVPQPEASKEEAPPAVEPETKIVYVERRRLVWTQVLGVALLVLGLLNAAWGMLTSYAVWALLASLAVVVSLPFLLSRKHPFLFAGWVAVALSCLFLNPRTSVAPWGLWGGIRLLSICLSRPEVGSSTLQFGAAVAMIRGALTLILAFLTARLCWERWKSRKRAKRDEAA